MGAMQVVEFVAMVVFVANVVCDVCQTHKLLETGRVLKEQLFD